MYRLLVFLALVLLAAALPSLGQRRGAAPYTPAPAEREELDTKKQALAERLKELAGKEGVADAAVFLHTAEMADALSLYANHAAVANVLHGLETGLQRCDAQEKGERPWATQPGRHLRGYVSRIDGSVQPYGVILPAGFDLHSATPYRLDVVLHGRGPTEVSFLQQMEPARTNLQSSSVPSVSSVAKPSSEAPFIELQPFGRGNNGWRWAGETDVFEALDQVLKQYPIDPDRIILRGFSMGGHGAWHIGVHTPSLWAAVSPGAGFTETRHYMNIKGEVPPYQELGWHIYDAVDYALNLFDAPFIGYGGEIDPQLQATRNMQAEAEKLGVPLTVIVGPQTAHRYHPDSLREIMAKLATAKRDPAPKQIRFTTWTLKYPRCAWVTIDGLEAHYRRAVVEAQVTESGLKLRTENVAALTLEPVLSHALAIDGQALPLLTGKLPPRLSLVRVGGKWRVASLHSFRKQHNLQGPIDDAFMDRFLAVRGTGKPWSAATQAFADAALKRFQAEWRLGFRGEVPVKDDKDVTPEDWRAANLILFGDPGSNSLLAKVVPGLPLRWTSEGVEAAGRSYGPDSVPVLIWPNPLSPDHYVVVNSGHTWTEKDLLASNASLFPKLPDWAILKPGAGTPEVLAADYFDESWGFKRATEKR